MTAAPELVWDLEAQLGEGPLWHDDALWFVDIKKPAIYRFDPSTADRRSWPAPKAVGFVVPRRRGGFIAGLSDGLYAFDPTSGAFERIVEVEPHLPDNRLNDGCVDLQGRLWFGTMDNGEGSRSGAIYCYDGQLRETAIKGVTITNGPSVSPDGRMLYWVDTLERKIAACDIRDDGSLGPSRPFVTIDKGYPDGPTVDAEGHVWIGLYAGWAARRYAPDGKLVSEVTFPVGNITKLALGGKDRRSAFATTARQFLKDEDLAKQPRAGGLFRFTVDVEGLPCPSVID